MTFTCGYFSFRGFSRDKLQEWEDETESSVLLVLPAAGSLTVRESGEDRLATAKDGGMATRRQMQNTCKVRDWQKGRWGPRKRKDEQKLKKCWGIIQKLEAGTKLLERLQERKEGWGRLKRRGFWWGKHSVLHNSKLVSNFGIFSGKPLWEVQWGHLCIHTCVNFSSAVEHCALCICRCTCCP